jgi:arylsulfatase A-like enzyme
MKKRFHTGKETMSLEYLNEKTRTNSFQRNRGTGKPPNIFLITIDMISPDFYHPSRPLSREMNLPSFRELAGHGVEFRNAFAPVPLCGPSRAASLTGRYTYVLGNGEHSPIGLETHLHSDDVIFPEYLRKIGYVTKHCGKCHVGANKFLDAFGENDNAWDQWYPPVYQDEAYLDYQRRLGVKPQKYSKEIVLLQQDRVTPGNSVGGWIVQEDGKPFPEEAQYSHFLVQRAIDKLEHAQASPSTAGQPIYLQLDIFDPHQPFTVPDGYAEREKELRAVMTLPETYKKVQASNWGSVPSQPEIYDLYRRYWGLYDPQSMIDYRVAHALQMEVVDSALGKFIQALKDRNLYDESVIILIGDHGEMNGRWGLVDKGVYLYPDVLRTPMIVKMPSSAKIEPQSIDAPVSLLDIAPTLLSVAGIEPDAWMDGQSLIPLMQGKTPPADRDMIFSCGWHVGVNFACGIQHWDGKGNHYLYAYNVSSCVDELYDLNAAEAENLAQDPEHANLRREMIDRLGTLLQSDSRWEGYWSSFRLNHFFELPKSPGSMQKNEP